MKKTVSICIFGALSIFLLAQCEAKKSSEIINTETEPEIIDTDKAYKFTEDFEGTRSSKWDNELPYPNGYSATYSDKYAATGEKSLRIELRKNDPNIHSSKRSELALWDFEGPAEEHTYSMSVLLPKGGDEDYKLDPKGSEIFWQWHNIPDVITNPDGTTTTEAWTFPPLSLRTLNGKYILEVCWDDDVLSTNAKMKAHGCPIVHDLGSYLEDKGKWVKWHFRIKWGWKDEQNPRIRIYKNGSMIKDIIGPNTTNDQRGNIMKIGFYKWDWAQPDPNTVPEGYTGHVNNSILTKRVIYFDAVSITED